jgi:3-phosphoglycerate kinase
MRRVGASIGRITMAISKKTVRDVDLRGKSVIMRVDFNVPMKDGSVLDDTRIRAALPTIDYVLKQGARRLVLMSHLGDPKKDIQKAREKNEKDGKPFDEKKFSEGKHRMAPVAKRLAALLQREVKLAPSCVGPVTEEMVRSLADGGILMLENTRFHKEETAKDPAEREKMAKVLATYGDIFVNDAFGTAHRAHASTETIAKFLPGVAGLLMEKELEYLQEKVVNAPAKPFVAIIGGAKVSSKIGVIEKLLEKVDCLIVGGGMAFTFFKAKGYEIGKSLCEDDQIGLAKTILEKSERMNVRLILPVDQVVASEFSEKGEDRVVEAQKMPPDMIGMDIGPKTIEAIKGALAGARTIFWNGPLGVFEMEKFACGTMAVAKAIAEMKDAVTVIGGGDSVAAVNKAGLAASMSHISTGGGASLELVEGKTLPGVAALQDR